MLRKATHPIDPVFTKRWSARAFDPSPMPNEDLLTMIEAARWAPSAYNIQPWRFVYIQREDQRWSDYVNVLNPFNASWGKDASALIFVASDTLVDQEADDPVSSGYHSFDTGAAWAQLGLQATMLGYSAHAVAGVLFDEAKALIKMPDRFKLEIAIVVGKRAHPKKLPQDLQQREHPSNRMALGDISFNGHFPND
ncbi:MAG: nitroreductase family protein [Methylocystaceae bacterium]|nr:nitroreductase family protein [Methylocystaceae bacterium]